LHELLVGYCEQALAHRDRPVETLRTQVENAITPLLPHGRARVEAVARTLGMSQRTLARRLSAEGLTFMEVIDSMRTDLALHYLRNATLSVSQVAWLLGQEVGAFNALSGGRPSPSVPLGGEPEMEPDCRWEGHRSHRVGYEDVCECRRMSRTVGLGRSVLSAADIAPIETDHRHSSMS
jgi:AraC-like DNA-binding protein